MRRRRSNLLLILVLLVVAVVVINTLLKPRPRPAVVSSQPDHRSGPAELYPPPEMPGATDSAVNDQNARETICRSGYTKSVRPSVSYTGRLKHELMDRYHLDGDVSDYELDHMIPLELGGCPACTTNLWMERYASPGAHEKDVVENYLHRQVCNGSISLSQAQAEIAHDWYAIYLDVSRQQRAN